MKLVASPINITFTPPLPCPRLVKASAPSVKNYPACASFALLTEAGSKTRPKGVRVLEPALLTLRATYRMITIFKQQPPSGNQFMHVTDEKLPTGTHPQTAGREKWTKVLPH
jgi:hypothetical protein